MTIPIPWLRHFLAVRQSPPLSSLEHYLSFANRSLLSQLEEVDSAESELDLVQQHVNCVSDNIRLCSELRSWFVAAFVLRDSSTFGEVVASPPSHLFAYTRATYAGYLAHGITEFEFANSTTDGEGDASTAYWSMFKPPPASERCLPLVDNLEALAIEAQADLDKDDANASAQVDLDKDEASAVLGSRGHGGRTRASGALGLQAAADKAADTERSLNTAHESLSAQVSEYHDAVNRLRKRSALTKMRIWFLSRGRQSLSAEAVCALQPPFSFRRIFALLFAQAKRSELSDSIGLALTTATDAQDKLNALSKQLQDAVSTRERRDAQLAEAQQRAELAAKKASEKAARKAQRKMHGGKQPRGVPRWSYSLDAFTSKHASLADGLSSPLSANDLKELHALVETIRQVVNTAHGYAEALLSVVSALPKPYNLLELRARLEALEKLLMFDESTVEMRAAYAKVEGAFEACVQTLLKEYSHTLSVHRINASAPRLQDELPDAFRQRQQEARAEEMRVSAQVSACQEALEDMRSEKEDRKRKRREYLDEQRKLENLSERKIAQYASKVRKITPTQLLTAMRANDASLQLQAVSRKLKRQTGFAFLPVCMFTTPRLFLPVCMFTTPRVHGRVPATCVARLCWGEVGCSTAVGSSLSQCCVCWVTLICLTITCASCATRTASRNSMLRRTLSRTCVQPCAP